jgi:hypothetical protein
MADSSFSETSFQVAAYVTPIFAHDSRETRVIYADCPSRSGGFVGVSVSAKAGAQTSKSKDSSSLEARAESSLIANYNVCRTTRPPTQRLYTHSHPSFLE